MYLTEVGEDTILLCNSCGYAANEEKADHKKHEMPFEDPLPLEEVSTPGQKTIDDLVRFLGVPHARTLKAVFYEIDGAPVFVAIRGDLEVNEAKLRNTLKAVEMSLLDDEGVKKHGLVAGSASPVGLNGIKIVGAQPYSVFEQAMADPVSTDDMDKILERFGEEIDLPMVSGSEDEQGLDISALRDRTGQTQRGPGFGRNGASFHILLILHAFFRRTIGYRPGSKLL